MATYLNEFLNGLCIDDEPPQVNSFQDALLYLVQHPERAGVSYTQRQEFLINNVGVLEVVDGYVTFSVPLKRQSELCSHFVSNVPFEVRVGLEQVSCNDVVLLCNSQYCESSVRFLLEENHLAERVTLSYKATLLQPEQRQRLVDTVIISGPLLYSDGVVRKV